MYKFFWNVRLWIKGLMLLILYPFVILWMVLIDLPISWAKDYENERHGIK